jgi:hypothetical protein
MSARDVADCERRKHEYSDEAPAADMFGCRQKARKGGVMGDDKASDVYKTVSASQERFAFFILAASASAIAFALVRTEGQAMACWMAPVGVAIALWGLSFWAGAEHVLARHEIFFLNLQLLKVEEGTDPVASRDQTKQKIIAEFITEEANRRNKAARMLGRAQYLLFLGGAVAYVCGHIMRLISQG